ncbi:hypothetical protein [Hyphomicrobium sp. D-2]|uniref:hypothetical protein n=1 Tax=Hyphomicrobium sp. D-2 TaxID=3041621 RepID=UPI0024549312|nr:hypothetical protein [Hyphomicrobium sp. D-2]MDH4982357.1 hypothetical protein [Hyphomicrobium sp. D-2]
MKMCKRNIRAFAKTLAKALRAGNAVSRDQSAPVANQPSGKPHGHTSAQASKRLMSTGRMFHRRVMDMSQSTQQSIALWILMMLLIWVPWAVE